jgi:hypothetical protein
MPSFWAISTTVRRFLTLRSGIEASREPDEFPIPPLSSIALTDEDFWLRSERPS